MKLHPCKKCGIPIWKGKYCYVCLHIYKNLKVKTIHIRRERKRKEKISSHFLALYDPESTAF